LFLATKTIDSAVGTEKEGKKSKKSKKWKKKIDKKRISRGNQRTGREEHHDQVVPQ
jgi:hypothetical protein